MIVLRNYLVVPGCPQLCPFDIVLCHPDDHAEIVRELEEHERMAAEIGDFEWRDE